GRIRADAQDKQAALREQQATLDETQSTALLEVDTTFRTLTQTAQAVESFRTGRLDRAKELLAMAQTGYQQGANSYLELLDAQRTYLSEQTDYYRALAAYQT